MRRLALFFIAVCFLVAAPARADEASKRAKIEEMLVVSRTEANMKQMMTQSGAQAQQMMKGMMGDQPASASDRKVMDDYLSKVMALLTQALDWPTIKPQFVDLYAAAYSEDEIDGILTFYKSPVGQSLLSKTPSLIARSNQIATARVQTIQPQLRELMNDMVKQIGSAPTEKKQQ